MVKGLVFGKFYPFHVGHQHLIDFALTHCDLLYVLVCASDKESIPVEIRQNWIQNTYKKQQRIKVVPFAYREDELPNTSESSRDISRVWSEVFKTLIPDLNIVFTSEKYGDYLAKFMNIQHLPFDCKREIVGISATDIRKKPFVNWSFLPKAVKPYFVKKIALLGTESTGKSTLAQALAASFNTNYVAEAAREILSSTKACSFSDLQKIARVHANQIQIHLSTANKILFLDTDCTITKSYSRFLFDKPLELNYEINTLNRADLYFFLTPNGIPYIQDGTRLDEKARNQLNEFHLSEIRRQGIQVTEINGSWEERFKQMKEICEIFIAKN